jgi:hypothetical protein
VADDRAVGSRNEAELGNVGIRYAERFDELGLRAAWVEGALVDLADHGEVVEFLRSYVPDAASRSHRRAADNP